VDYTSALKHAVGPPSRSWKPLAFGGCCAARGAAYFEKGELADAIRDIDAAIRWLPANAKFYELRAKAKIALGDLPAATTDLSFCLALDPKIAATPQYHRDQGLVCICQRDWARALLSLRRFMELSQVNQDYAALWIYLLRVQLGEPREAPAGELTAYLRNRKPIEAGDWFPTLAAFVLGELPEPDLFAAAKSSNPAQTTGMQCEAWFYAGWQAERSGDRAAALRSYRKCIATQSVTSWEFPLARSWIPLLDRP
jgi:tetratricopeptide (TPR) repeat protein